MSRNYRGEGGRSVRICFVVTCTLTSSFTNEEVIAAGTSRAYDFRVVITGTNADDSVSLQLQTDTTVVTGEIEGTAPASQIDDFDGTNAATAEYNFIWSDMSAAGHNDVDGATADGADAAASDDWINGRFVKSLPTDQQTVSN